MSIFDGFTDRMSNIFRVVKCGYRNCDCDCEIATKSKILGQTFRDPTSYPLARGRVLPPDLRSDYILDWRRFECFVGDKRKWIEYDQIFDVDIRCINDFMVLVALGGDFDKSLPMTDQEGSEEVGVDTETNGYNGSSRDFLWSVTPLHPDCSKYWNIVGSHIERNILSHVRPECQLTARCIPIENYNRYNLGYNTQTFRIELHINSINNDRCYWHDIDSILQQFGKMTRKISMSPTIIFNLTICKDE